MDLISPQPPSTDDGHSDLAAARLIRAAAIAARTAGSIDAPLPILSDTQINATLNDADDDAWVGRPLLIRGYSVLAEIGTGGQATVYRGVQESTGRQVAIKVIPGGPFVSTRRRSRFDREAKLLAGLDHPNIVGIIDRGRTEDGSFFIVMDLIEGVPLDQYWTQLERRPETLARLFAKIADAVDAAHTAEIVHRDLKPANIRIDRRGEPHILDFGLARLSDSLSEDLHHASITQSGQLLGSLPWSSPEQARGDEDTVDFRTDVYSLGVMLYQAIAGEFPYRVTGTLRDILDNIAKSIPSPPSKALSRETNGDFRALDEITLRALAKQPNDRYASARELKYDLDRYLAGEPLHARRPRYFTRAKLVNYALPLLLLAIAVVAVASSWKAPTPPSPVADVPQLIAPLGMTFVRIPAGTALIGSPPTEAGRGTDETMHKATFPKFFWISTAPVTQKQFRLIMGFNPSDQRFLGDSMPVQRVSWYEAEAFCERFPDRKRGKFRLPTEAEWEYACRAGEVAPFGNGRSIDEVGWWSGNSGNKLHPVASLAPNFWGLYDMHGDVAEWCFDPYRQDAFSTSAAGESLDHNAARVIRGGSFLSSAVACRAAARDKAPPATRRCDLGFRVVCETDSTPPAGP